MPDLPSGATRPPQERKNGVENMNERMIKIKAREAAFNGKMRELNAQGFCSGGWDPKTDKTAIVDTRIPECEFRIAGYMDRDLNIAWCDGFRRAENV